MKNWSWKWWIGLTLTAVVVGLSLWHIALIHEPKTFFDYFVLDLAFLPVQVVLVSIIIERMLHEREKRALIKKLNMVIGAFFSEVGSELLRLINPTCPHPDRLGENFQVGSDWSPARFREATAQCRSLPEKPAPDPEALSGLREFLLGKRRFVLALLQNPNLLEHDTFTDLLWAVTHLTEELEARSNLADLPRADLAHLAGDVARAHALLIREWLAYMDHLRADYPYIFSLAVRMNPFQVRPDPVIGGE